MKTLRINKNLIERYIGNNFHEDKDMVLSDLCAAKYVVEINLRKDGVRCGPKGCLATYVLYLIGDEQSCRKLFHIFHFSHALRSHYYDVQVAIVVMLMYACMQFD